MDRLFRWIEQFDIRLDWQHDDPFFELESVTDWTDAGAAPGSDGAWGVDELAVA